MTKATVINNIKIVGLALILAVGMSYAYAWTAPTATPPANNVAAPINTSANAQLKNGPLGVNGYFTAYSGLSANNNLIKEVATPIDGTDAVNKDYVDAATGSGVPCGYKMVTTGIGLPKNETVGCQTMCVAHAVSNTMTNVSSLVQTVIYQCYN